MPTNPHFVVRFFVRTTKTQDADSPTPLRAKVWLSHSKQYYYVSTNQQTTQRKFSLITGEGAPRYGADPELVKIVDRYKAAIQFVISAAIVNNRVNSLTSEELTARVNLVADRMKRNEDFYLSEPEPILVYTSPRYVPLCDSCVFKGKTCRANFEEEIKDMAPDHALFSGVCPMSIDKNRNTENLASVMMPMVEEAMSKAINEKKEFRAAFNDVCDSYMEILKMDHYPDSEEKGDQS